MIYALRPESFCALNSAIRKVQTFWASGLPPSFGQNPKEEQLFFVKPSQIHIVWEMKNLILKMKFGFANNAEDFKSMLWMKSSPVGLWVGLGQLGGRVERSLAEQQTVSSEQQGIVQLCSSCSFIQFMHSLYIVSFLIFQIFTSAIQLDPFYRGFSINSSTQVKFCRKKHFLIFQR